MIKSKTIRKDKLKRMIEQGKVLIKCCFHLTDDYGFDNSNDFGKTEYMPARIVDDGKDFIQGYINLFSCYFEWKNARCIDYGNGNVTFYVHSNLNYEIKFI